MILINFKPFGAAAVELDTLLIVISEVVTPFKIVATVSFRTRSHFDFDLCHISSLIPLITCTTLKRADDFSRLRVGCEDGCDDGCDDGCRDGCNDGCDDGCSEGCDDGFDDGCDVGLDGCDDGCIEG